jgi:PKD repeat protein
MRGDSLINNFGSFSIYKWIICIIFLFLLVGSVNAAPYIGYTSQYPPGQNDTYVKATSSYTPDNYYPYYATDPTKNLLGSTAGNAWESDYQSTNQRFHIDLGGSKIITRIYYEQHLVDRAANVDAKDFTFWGSNTAGSFSNLTYSNDTGWTQLITCVTYFNYRSGEFPDPKYVTVDNKIAYRYYAVKIANNYGAGGSSVIALRRIELQTQDILISNFSSNVTYGTAPLAVSFNGTSLNTTSWAWLFGDENWSNNFWIVKNSSSGWVARYGHATVVLGDGSIVLTGGYDNVALLNDTWRSTDNGSTWTRMNASSGWEARDGHAMVALSDGSIVLFGGGSGVFFNDTWRSIDNGATWTRINTSSGWSARQWFSGTTMMDDSIVMVGGYNAGGFLNDTWRSTNNGATWTRMNASSGWSPRYTMSIQTLTDNSILLMGGSNSTSAIAYNDTWRSTNNGATWTRMNASGGWLGGHVPASAVMPDGSVVITGGYYYQLALGTNQTWRSADKGATWSLINSNPPWVGRWHLTAVVIPNGSIVMTGGAGAGLYNDSWIFTPTTSVLQNVTHTYSLLGTYNVSLQVNNYARTNSTQKPEYIHIGNQPVASFTQNISGGLPPVAVGMFNGTGTYNPIIWNWSFGDGSYSDNQNTTHTFTGLGNYSVTLNATNVYGSGTFSHYFNVTDPINASFTTNPLYGVAPLTVTFTDTSNGYPTGWNWSFGDGDEDNVNQNPVHTYDSAGNYSVSLRAFNDYNSNSTPGDDTINVTYGPTALFNVTPNPAALGTMITFVDMSTNSPVTWNWTLGDGNTSTSRNITHIYPAIGIYNVTLNVSYLNGFSNYSSDVTIYPSTPVANFTMDHNIGSNPLTVQFTDTTTGSGITDWYWVFGDGNVSTLQNPSHQYTNLGTYYVTLMVSSSVGTNVSQPQIIYIVNSAIPIADFTGAPVAGSAPLSVQFTDMSVALSGVTAWNWSFGDGNYSNAQNPVYIYSSSGQYNVMLVATSGVFSNYTTKYGYVNIGVLLNTVSADYSATPTYAANYPATVTFTDHSVCNPVCTNWVWDFNGDGAVDSLAQNPTYTYTYPGNYSPKLIVSNGLNTGTKIRNLYIVIGPVLVKPTIPQPTAAWRPGYQYNGTLTTFKGNANIDLQNSTYLKYWLQNFSTTRNFSVYGFALGVMAPIMHVFGFWIFLIIWGLYLFAVWIRSQDVTMPLIIGILTMGTFGLLFPQESLPVIIIMFVICGAIIITKLMKDSL